MSVRYDLQALRVSMEEQRQRQEDEARRAQANDTVANKQPETIKEAPNEEAMLKRALAMSLEGTEESTATNDNAAPCRGNVPDFTNMTEEEQIAFAMQMSMQDQRKFLTDKSMYYANQHRNPGRHFLNFFLSLPGNIRHI